MIPTSTRTRIALSDRIPAGASAVALIAPEGQPPDVTALSAAEKQAVGALLATGVFKGKTREVAANLVETRQGVRHLLVAGIGPAEKSGNQPLREAASALVRASAKRGIQHLAILLPRGNSAAAVESLLTGAKLAAFRYEEDKGAASTNGEAPPATVTLVGKSGAMEKSALLRSEIIADAQNFARTIAYRPGNNVNPPELARIATAMAKETGLRCRVLTDRDATRLGMEGLLAVGAGSPNPPRLICLEHKPAKAKGAPLLLVGKSITFDTGGISIKPADRMGRMIFDKCGGMAVLGAMCAIARLKLPVHVVGLLSSAENHVSGKAYRPGDVLRMYNGVTVEVTNTDAEGRLVLADALAWGIETFKPAAVVDLATLTGGVVVALGKVQAGVMANNDALVAELQWASSSSGERFWRLPLDEEYRELMRSEPADIANAGPREASPIQGGIFLSWFVKPEVPWAHIDIAGVAETEKELPLYAKGPTGWGVRTIVEWVARRAEAF